MGKEKQTVKNILLEEDGSRQKSLIKGEFIQSKKYPSYLMNLVHSEICDCDCCIGYNIFGINESHTTPVNGCSLPINRSPLQVITSPKETKLKLLEAMFKFAWKSVQTNEDTDSTVTSESESIDEEQTGNETEESESSDDVWIDL